MLRGLTGDVLRARQINGLNTAIRMLGGPIGIAMTIAATASAFWTTSTKDSVEAGTELADATDRLKKNYDEATKSVKNLTDAERARYRLCIEGAVKWGADEIASQSKMVRACRRRADGSRAPCDHGDGVTGANTGLPRRR
ncbi:hypothetical protein DHODJN_25890 [Methylorubrum extorquens]